MNDSERMIAAFGRMYETSINEYYRSGDYHVFGAFVLGWVAAKEDERKASLVTGETEAKQSG